ncbi:MAG: hypothetical protein ACR2NO_01835 [Chloroflexota bacterium]
MPFATRAEIAILGVSLAVSAVLRLLTYHPIADGAGSRYSKTVVVSVVAAALVWILVRLQTANRSIPILCALAVILAGDAVHYVRLAHPVTRGAPIRSFVSDLKGEERARREWEFTTSGEGQIKFDGSSMRLSSPTRSTAYVQAKLPPALEWGSAWWLPVGLGERERVEEITWRATVRRERDYFVVLDVNPLLIQVVPYGLHITYPDAAGTLRGHEVPHPIGQDAQPHDWQLARDTQNIRLNVDGRQVWSASQRGPLRQLRLGETRSDPEHGGAMSIERVSFLNHLEGKRA